MPPVIPKSPPGWAVCRNDIADPYVERMVEAFSFLTARTQLKIDAEFPVSPSVCWKWSAQLRHSHASMSVAQLASRSGRRRSGEGFTVPRDTAFFRHSGRRKHRLPVSQQPECNAVAARHRRGATDRRAAGYACPAPLPAGQHSRRRCAAYYPAHLW